MERYLKLILAWVASFLLIYLPHLMEENVEFTLLVSMFGYLHEVILTFLLHLLQPIGLIFFLYATFMTIKEFLPFKKSH